MAAAAAAADPAVAVSAFVVVAGLVLEKAIFPFVVDAVHDVAAPRWTADVHEFAPAAVPLAAGAAAAAVVVD